MRNRVGQLQIRGHVFPGHPGEMSPGGEAALRLWENPFVETIEERSYHCEAAANTSHDLQSWLKASVIYQFLARDGDMSYNDFDGHKIRLRCTLVF